MVESEAAILSEETMLGAVVYGHEQMQAALTRLTNLLLKLALRSGTGHQKQKTLRLKIKLKR